MKKYILKIWRKLHRIVWCIASRICLFLLFTAGQMPDPQPEHPIPGEKVIYLTFDDGPSRYTERLLEILKHYNVKATFFVVSTSAYFPVVKKEAADGHTIGNHTANHIYKKLYADENSFFDALKQAEQKILEYTGIRTTFLRFPGGSCSIRRHAKEPGFDHTVTRLVQEWGYQYVDWNVSAMDAGKAWTPAEVYRNVIRGVQEKTVLLYFCMT